MVKIIKKWSIFKDCSDIPWIKKNFVDRNLLDEDEPTIPCLHKQLDKNDPKMKGQPRMLSCPCPHCSPTYL